MQEEEYVDYLILGGIRHGEVWNGLKEGVILQLPAKSQRMAKFYGRDTEAEITLPLNDAYFITKHKTKDGKHFMVASTEPLSAFNVDEEIKKADPPPSPID